MQKNYPLINCKQKEGRGGRRVSSLAYMISTLGQMMSSIKMDTAICHLFPHQSNLRVFFFYIVTCVCVCLCVCACVFQGQGDNGNALSLRKKKA